ncbi:hypothetical protein [Corynebacterium aurimucosum]
MTRDEKETPGGATPGETETISHYILRSLIHSGQLQDKINAL